MPLEDLAVAEEEAAGAGEHVDQEKSVGVEVGTPLLRDRDVGVAVAAPRKPREVQGEPVASVRRDYVDRPFVAEDDALPWHEDLRHELSGVEVVVVEDEGARTRLQPLEHGALLMAPGAGLGAFDEVAAFPFDIAYGGRLAGQGDVVLDVGAQGRCLRFSGSQGLRS
jgi:hypothetical protein